jgi:deoxyribodipyrimidine photo-lyase
MTARSLVWYRGNDLRVSDHRPLSDAAKSGEVVPVFVLAPHFFAVKPPRRGAHRMQFLIESLVELNQNLARLGSKLIVVSGKTEEVIPRLARQWNVDRVVAQRVTEPLAREWEKRIAQVLRVPLILFDGETLLPPATLRTGAGTPYSVFTPFARAFGNIADEVGSPLLAPRKLPPLPSDLSNSESLAIPCLTELGISYNQHLQSGGEAAAKRRLQSFLRTTVADYSDGRDRMDLPGTSRLSADLSLGTISVRTVWDAVCRSRATPRAERSLDAFCNELIWREFAHSTLWDRPELINTPFRKDFLDFPWRKDDGGWDAWVEGTTGYPVVDAAARQLLTEGWVHNRARMVAASFLTKHLMIDFRLGEEHYFEQLVDADMANNDMGWQWSAGCGCDAQPYFRIFNPMVQGERFDPDGQYVRRWIPELARLPAKYIHRPATAPSAVLQTAGVVPGKTYPEPRVDHMTARSRFIQIADSHLSRARASAGSCR